MKPNPKVPTGELDDMPPPLIAEGQVLFGKYRLIERIGAGTVGEVWLVQNLQLDTERALKLIRPELVQNDKGWQRFKREAQVMARFNHPNVVTIYNLDRTQSVGYIEMEFVRGRSLADIITELHGQPMPLVSIAHVLDQLCSVLREAHGYVSKPIIHGGLKPSNLMLVDEKPPGQNLKVLDFGIAKMVEDDRSDDLTGLGGLLGTAAYISPEQIRGGNANEGQGEMDGRSDLYAVGVLLYQFLTGSLPFMGSKVAVLTAHLNSTPPPMKQANPNVYVPPPVEQVVMLCLEKDPANRPRSARELAERFEAALFQTKVKDLRTPRRSAGPIVTTAALAAGAAGVAIAVAGPAAAAVAVAVAVGGTVTVAAGAYLSRVLVLSADDDRDQAVPVDIELVEVPAGVNRRVVGNAALKATPGPGHEFTGADQVNSIVFAPLAVRCGRSFLVQVFLHRPDQVRETRRLARLYDAKAKERGFKTLEVGIPLGTSVVVHLQFTGLEVDAPSKTIRWWGRPESATFVVSVPPDHAPGDAHGTVTLRVADIPAGSISFQLEVARSGRTRKNAEPVPVGDEVRHFQLAFISYATPNRAEVLKRVQVLKALRINFFQDFLSLEPFERWQRKLELKLDECDLFLLFWSTPAKESQWVLEELRHAIRRKNNIAAAPPEIRAIIVEGPPAPSPPDEFREFQFSDWMLDLINASAKPAPSPQSGT